MASENENSLCESAQRIDDGLRRYYKWKGEKYQRLKSIEGMNYLCF